MELLGREVCCAIGLRVSNNSGTVGLGELCQDVSFRKNFNDGRWEGETDTGWKDGLLDGSTVG